MDKDLLKKYFPLFLAVLFLLIYGIVFSSLPDRIPVHFQGDGTPDGWMSRTMFPFMMIGLGLILYVVLTHIRQIDPKGEDLRQKRDLFILIRNLTMAFIFFLALFSVWMAIKGKVPAWSISALIGGLTLMLGNLLPRVPINWFVGLRNPWTLSSATIWKKAHRVGGILFVISGLAVIVLPILGLKPGLVMSVILIPMFIFTGLVYPFLLFIREKNKEPKEKS